VAVWRLDGGLAMSDFLSTLPFLDEAGLMVARLASGVAIVAGFFLVLAIANWVADLVTPGSGDDARGLMGLGMGVSSSSGAGLSRYAKGARGKGKSGRPVAVASRMHGNTINRIDKDGNSVAVDYQEDDFKGRKIPSSDGSGSTNVRPYTGRDAVDNQNDGKGFSLN